MISSIIESVDDVECVEWGAPSLRGVATGGAADWLVPGLDAAGCPFVRGCFRGRRVSEAAGARGRRGSAGCQYEPRLDSRFARSRPGGKVCFSEELESCSDGCVDASGIGSDSLDECGEDGVAADAGY